MSEFSKIERYKINTQKPLSFLPISNEKSEKELRKQYNYHHIKGNKIPLNKLTYGDKRPAL